MCNILTEYFESIETIGFDGRVGIGKAENEKICKMIVKGKNAWNWSFIIDKYFLYRIVIDYVPKLQEVRISNQEKGVLV